jgi:hypothetical protein
MIAEVLSAGASRPACAYRGSTSTSKVFRSTSAPSAVSLLSAIAIWRASPGKVRAVAGQMHKAQTSDGEG